MVFLPAKASRFLQKEEKSSVLSAPRGDRYVLDTLLLCLASRRTQIVSRAAAPITRTGSVRSTPSTKTLA
jgi:hypothetical protein